MRSTLPLLFTWTCSYCDLITSFVPSNETVNGFSDQINLPWLDTSHGVVKASPSLMSVVTSVGKASENGCDGPPPTYSPHHFSVRIGSTVVVCIVWAIAADVTNDKNSVAIIVFRMVLEFGLYPPAPVKRVSIMQKYYKFTKPIPDSTF